MFRSKFKIFLCLFSAIIIAFSCFSINCFAAPYDESNPLRVSISRPSAGSTTGFIEVLTKNSSGGYGFRVLSWSISEDEASEYADFPFYMNLKVTTTSIVFSLPSSSFDLSFASICAFASNGNSFFRLVDSSNNYTYTYSTGNTIVGFHVYGNYRMSSNAISDPEEFCVLYSGESTTFNQLRSVISLLTQLANNDETIISKLQTIINNTDTIESKLQSALNLLTTIETDLDEVNAELDRIESNTDNLETQLNTIINILDNKNQVTPSPDKSVTNDYAAKEEALIAGTSSGRDEANKVFTDFNSLLSDNLSRGLLAVSAIMSEFIGFSGISWLSTLLYFSLALGVFGFILGMGFIIVSRSFNSEKYNFYRKKRNK